MNNALAAAFEYHEQHCNVIFAKAGTKNEPVAWRRWQYRQQSDADIDREYWYAVRKFESDDLNLAVVLGDASNNRFVLDCESPEAFTRWTRTVTALGYNAPVVATARGGHIHFASTSPVSGSTDYTKTLGFEIRGQKQYVMVPHSRHPSGTFYEWLNKPDMVPVITSTDALPFCNLTFTNPILKAERIKRQWPRLVIKVIGGDEQTIADYGSMSEVDQAVITAMLNAGHGEEAIEHALMSYDSHFKAKTDKYRRDYLNLSIRKAKALGDSTAFKAARQTAATVRVMVLGAPMSGRSRAIRKSVLAAFVGKYERAGGACSFSAREAAESALCSVRPAIKALDYWQSVGVIERLRLAGGEYADTYALHVPKPQMPLNAGNSSESSDCTQITDNAKPVHKGTTTSQWRTCEVVFTFALACDFGVFERRGLGLSARDVYAACVGHELTRRQIAEYTGMSADTVKRMTIRLVEHDLLIRDDSGMTPCFQSRAPDNVNWYALGEGLNTLTLGDERKRRHAAERIVYRRQLATRRQHDVTKVTRTPDVPITIADTTDTSGGTVITTEAADRKRQNHTRRLRINVQYSRSMQEADIREAEIRASTV